ncbi:YwiC-like family protein [Halalkalibacter krulwichiae]|uniref:YwiC-like protein n=1 Tax=Halalkalibacter krulwichiae TaxID=199441 RepID=A0A1X9MAK1_9BACI|nr:YwiC-like family protein [Halalkalibacter krulwichiae]ARK30428.1 hypothetical protein BkAM31D_11660 [Halalkalibacter krulwichiae]
MVLPKEHGTWMMFFLPFLLGVITSTPSLVHIPLFVGWFFLYLASTPLLTIYRNKKRNQEMFRWLILYAVVACIFLIPIIWIYPFLLWLGLCLFPLLLVNIYFINKKNERSLWNNLSGIITFTLGGVASYAIVAPYTIEVILLLILVAFYFTASAFYVKSLIRERKNIQFKKKSHLFHLLLLLVPTLLCIPLFTFAYLPSALKDWLTSRKKQLQPMKIGIIEIVNGCIFFVLYLVLM